MGQSLPWIPIFIPDYLADTQHLSTEEHGAYLLLIFNYWQTGKPLNNANGRLANVVRLSNERWAVVQSSLEEFFTIEGNIWRHGRLDDELIVANKKLDARVNAGRQSGRSRRDELLSEGRTELEQNSNKYPENRIEENRKEKNRKHTYSKLFLEWYEIYPRKQAMGASEVAYLKALKDVSHETLMDAVRRYRSDPNLPPLKKHIPLASTWLNQRRFDDVEALPSNGGKTEENVSRALRFAETLEQEPRLAIEDDPF